MITIEINGTKYETEEGKTILEVAEENNIKIPTLCFNKALENYGACRLCTVEVVTDKDSKLVTACTSAATDGLKVLTDSEWVTKSRKLTIELLLSRSPEEEVLINLAKEYGIEKLRFKKKDDDCVLCGLCVRMCEKMGAKAINFQNRGEKRSINTAFDENSDECMSCGACYYICPTSSMTLKKMKDFSGRTPIKNLNDFDMGLVERPCIYIPFLQAVPKLPQIDIQNCVYLQTGACGICEKVCEVDAIDYKQEDVEEEITVGGVVVATGYEQLDLTGSEFNIEHPNVITGLHIERMLSPTGPTLGHVLKPSDWIKPRSVTFVQCAGSRDERHCRYCSGICCLYATKNAMLLRQEDPEVEINILYIDYRTGGRFNEEYYQRLRSMNINIIKGRPSEILEGPEGTLMMDIFDDNIGKLLQITTDMVVLSVGLVPSEGSKDIIEKLHLVFGQDGFATPTHIKIAPVDTSTTGVFLAGTITGPKSIPDCITDAGTAAARLSTFLKDKIMTISLDKAHINGDLCIQCGLCDEICHYDAIDTTNDTFEVLPVSCRGCGLCAGICPTNAIDLRQYLDSQIESQVQGILEAEPNVIIAYCCAQCGYNAADVAGTARLDYPKEIRIVRIPCTGRMSLDFVLMPFNYGARGVMVVGCLEDQCHFIDGNIKAKERAEKAKKALDLLGIGGNRLEFFNMSSADGPKFVEAANRMVEQC
jgi:heterodisulfide reductase subunit A